MTDRLIAGVDPGKIGALAIIDAYTGDLIDVRDMPVIGRDVNGAQVAAILAEWATLGDIRVVLEDVRSMPTDSHVSAFSFGRSKGIVEGCVASAGLPLHLVGPAKWKRDAGIAVDPTLKGRHKSAALKNASRLLATNTWPTWCDTFSRVKDSDRAEAAIIALWGRAHGEVWAVTA